jgi:DNA-binding MurR/RpiR family transcriptional regulator
LGKSQKRERGKFDLEGVILGKYSSLPENQRKVADFLLQHAREVPFFSILEIEKRSGTSKATIVRLAQSLGFSGFLELRARMMQGIQSAIQMPDRFPLLEGTDHKEALSIVARQDVKNINQTINHLDRQTFRDVAQMLLQARHVYTLGLGISSLMSQILAYSLNQAAVRATAFVHDYETFMEQLAFATPSDVLCAFSFPPYSKETIDVVASAAKKKIRVIAITDKLTSPITFYSKKVLPIRSQNILFTNSFSAISVVINALVTEVAMRNKEKAMKMTKEVDQLLHESGHYAVE